MDACCDDMEGDACFGLDGAECDPANVNVRGGSDGCCGGDRIIGTL